MGIFDKFKGQSGNQAEEEQQDANQPGYQDPTQGGGYQDQNQNRQNQGDQSGYDPNQDQYGDQNRGQ